MKRAIIGCSIIKNDILGIIEKLPYECDVFWMDEELHDSPEKLHKVLQEKIDELADYDEIILSFMLCGNALLGIKSDTSRLVFMIADDCIYATMCHRDDYSELRKTSIFTSHGWLNTRKNTMTDFSRSVKRYGEERAQQIFKMMYKNYKNVVYMKLEDEISPENRQKAEEMAQRLGLELLYRDGSLDFYRELFDRSGSSDRICVLEPGNAVSMDIFMGDKK